MKLTFGQRFARASAGGEDGGRNAHPTALLQLGVLMAARGHEGPVRIEATLNAESFYRRHGFVRTGTGFSSHRGAGAPIEIVHMELVEWRVCRVGNLPTGALPGGEDGGQNAHPTARCRSNAG